MNELDGNQNSPIPRILKFLLVAVGVCIIAFSGFETWKLGNVSGYTTLIIIGFLLLFVAATGELPTEISLGGVTAKTPRKPPKMSASNAALKVTESRKESAGAAKLGTDPLQFKNSTFAKSSDQAQEIEKYDEILVEAILKAFPDSYLHRNATIGRVIVDYSLIVENRSLYIETKHLIRSESNFLGKTLTNLINFFPEGASLLVISNAKNVQTARNKVKKTLGSRGEVISWNGKDDDQLLRNTILELLTQ